MIRASHWKSCVIASGGTASAVCDLGRPYESLLIDIPTITTATITVEVSRTSTGTAEPLHTNAGDDVVITDSGDGEIMFSVPYACGAQYITLLSSQTQGAKRTFYIRGFNGAVITQ